MYSSYPGRHGDRSNSWFSEQARRARFDDRILNERYVKPPSDHMGSTRREEDWRSPEFTQRSGAMYKRSYGSWKSGDSKSWRPSPCDHWKKEREPSPRRCESWRNENSWRPRTSLVPRASMPRFSEGSVRDNASPSSQTREWPEPPYERDLSPTSQKGGSIKGLNDDELEKAALLQLKLMAEMESNDGKVDYLTGSKREQSESELHEKTSVSDGYNTSGEKEITESKPIVSDSQDLINKLETTAQLNNSQSESVERLCKANEPSNSSNGSLVVLKNSIEDVHVLTRNSGMDAAALHSRNTRDENWYEDYLKKVNKEKTELQTSLSGPDHLLPSSATCEVQQSSMSRLSPDVSHCSESSLIDSRSTSRNNLSVLESTSRSPVIPKDRETDLHSRSSNLIDPNQYVEELSDSEDWDEIAQLVCRPRLKRPQDFSSEQLPKRCLLDLPRDPSPSYVNAVKPEYLHHNRSAAVADSTESISATGKQQSLCSSVEEKSYFRIEYPNMPQGNYWHRTSYDYWRHKEEDLSEGASETIADHSRELKSCQSRIAATTSRCKDLGGNRYVDWHY